MLKGVIASPAHIQLLRNGFKLERSLSVDEIRYYALYWDKIVIPGSNIIYVQVPDEDILIETGVIQRPRVEFGGTWSGEKIAYTFPYAQSVVADKLIKEDRHTDWTIHQIGQEVLLPSEYMTKQFALRFDLANALPVPHGDVPIPDILEFKQRRRDELNSLHAMMDQVYLDILKSPDMELSRNTAVRNLKVAIDNINKVSSEKWNRVSAFNWSIEMNLNMKNLFYGAASGNLFGAILPWSNIPLFTIIGGAMSILSVKATYSNSFTPAQNSSKFAYLSSAANEKIL